MDGSQSDAGNTTDGGESEVKQAVCMTDDDCAKDEVCYVPYWYESKELDGSECVARCDDREVCAGPAVGEGLVSLASDDVNICIALGAARLFAWDTRGHPLELATGFQAAQAVAVVDGRCYFGSENGMMRVALDGKSAPESLTTQQGMLGLSAWTTSSYVFWSYIVDGQLELWRLERGAIATAELIFQQPVDADATEDETWRAGNTTHVFRSTGPTLVKAPLSNVSATEILPQSGVPAYADDERLFFVPSQIISDLPPLYYPTTVWELDLTDASATPKKRGVVSPTTSRRSRLRVSDGWLYQSIADGPNSGWVNWSLSADRTPLEGEPAPEQVLLVERNLRGRGGPGAAQDTDFALSGQRIAFVTDTRIMAVSIPQSVCSNPLLCPRGMTCDEDRRCH